MKYTEVLCTKLFLYLNAVLSKTKTSLFSFNVLFTTSPLSSFLSGRKPGSSLQQ